MVPVAGAPASLGSCSPTSLNRLRERNEARPSVALGQPPLLNRGERLGRGGQGACCPTGRSLERRLGHTTAADEDEACDGHQATDKTALHRAMNPDVSRTARHTATVLRAAATRLAVA